VVCTGEKIHKPLNQPTPHHTHPPTGTVLRIMASSFTAGILPSAVERAVVSKGRLSTSSLSSPLILIHAAAPTLSSSSAHKAQAFARHAHFLYHHLLGKLRDSSRYRGVVLVGLEDLPRIMHQPDEEEADEQEGVLAALDGFALPQIEDDSRNMQEVLPLDMSSADAFVQSIRRALPTQQPTSSPSTPSRGSSKKEGKEEGEEGEEEEEEDGQQDIALGIDSLNMLAHQLKSMPATVMALRKLLLHNSSSSSSSSSSGSPSLSPLLTILHSEGNNRPSLLSKAWRLALEDLATTNVYLYPQDEVSGRGLVVRKSASGKVHEEWESYTIDSNDGTVLLTSSSSIPATSKQDKSTTTKATATTVAMTPLNASSSSKKEAAFLESLPFRLSLTEQEKAMRGQVVLPHERQRNDGGHTNLNQPQQPLIYHEVEGGEEDEEDEEEEEYDDDIDDDLDL